MFLIIFSLILQRIISYICNLKFNACAELRVGISTQDGRMRYLTMILSKGRVCNQHIIVKHILTDCIDFLQDRNKYFQVRDLRQLFQDVPVDNILSFLKDTNIFNKI